MQHLNITTIHGLPDAARLAASIPTLYMLMGSLSMIHDRYSYTGFLASITHVVLAALNRKKKICSST